jgi:hypothetical protein
MTAIAAPTAPAAPRFVLGRTRTAVALLLPIALINAIGFILPVLNLLRMSFNEALAGGGVRETVTVRKTSFSVGVERIFPLHGPIVSSIEVVRRGRVRRAKLYYLRNLRGKAARIKERDTRTKAASTGSAGQPQGKSASNKSSE